MKVVFIAPSNQDWACETIWTVLQAIPHPQYSHHTYMQVADCVYSPIIPSEQRCASAREALSLNLTLQYLNPLPMAYQTKNESLGCFVFVLLKVYLNPLPVA